MLSQAAQAAQVSGWQKEAEVVFIKRLGKEGYCCYRNPSHTPCECCARVFEGVGQARMESVQER